MAVIEVKNLVKSYGQVRAVDGVSFVVGEGEIFGLLGPNGAGKTTTMEILEGLRPPDQGEVVILGKNIATHLSEIRREIGIVLQSSSFFPELEIKELLQMFAGFYGRSDFPKDLAQRFDLEGILSKRFPQLSGGQRQRFVLATALLHQPKLLFLDEPTIGLDPGVRQKFWDIILNLRKAGLTILLTTHYMEEAEIVCDRVAIIDRGKIVAADRPIKLINSMGILSHIKFVSNKPIVLADLEQIPGIISVRRDRYAYDLETQNPESSLRELLSFEKHFGGKIFNLSVRQATLEDVFLKLTGHYLQD